MLQAAQDRQRYVLCHDERDGDPQLATTDGDVDEDVDIRVDGEIEHWPGHLFAGRSVAAAVVARFVRDGGMDESVEWRSRSDYIY